MSTLAEKPPQKPPEPPAPAEPPKSHIAAMGASFVQPAPKPPSAAPALKQLPEAWAAESAQQLRQASDENSARTVDLWLAVAKTPAVAAFKDEPLTLEEYERGIETAKKHSPAEHATRKNGAR